MISFQCQESCHCCQTIDPLPFYTKDAQFTWPGAGHGWQCECWVEQYKISLAEVMTEDALLNYFRRKYVLVLSILQGIGSIDMPLAFKSG